ncbi:hypothetical protein GJU40_19135 [Bacillus lacus]|uniref:Uncharacterized protein n=1 Tax=Metabacillus lacus TaxID=1983721 RepID=A0A7X2LZ42_9BACI|nr:hypothetical protein [Metabacillus lacus]MRX74240.1 hypothetical protein [Metabacillus lacus]
MNKKEPSATKENLRAVGALDCWWNRTITYQVDLSKIRLLTVGFTGLPLSVKAPTVSAAETEEKKVSDNPIMKSLHSFKEITESVWDGLRKGRKRAQTHGMTLQTTSWRFSGWNSRYMEWHSEPLCAV